MVVARWRAIASILMLLVALTGCGGAPSTDAGAAHVDGQTAQSASDGAGSNGGGGDGAPGAPLGENGGVAAAGAPINIPAITEVSNPWTSIEGDIEGRIRTACRDDTLCVDIDLNVVDKTSDNDPSNDKYPDCALLAGSPAQTVKRGGAITLSIAAPCGTDGRPVGGPAEESEDIVDGGGSEPVEGVPDSAADVDQPVEASEG
jgi:hypothetical protein